MSALSALEQLKARLNDVHYINSSAALLGWDQQVNMPEGGAATRAAQMSTLARLSHETFTAPLTGELLAAAAQELAEADYDSDDAALIRITQHDYDRATRIPAALIAEINETAALAHGEWAHARATNNFAHFAPWLEKVVGLNQRLAEHIGYTDRPYDALLDQFEPGMSAADVTAMFEDLKRTIVPLVAAIRERQDQASDEVLRREFPEDKQREFTVRVAKEYGFDFERGRQDKSVHPFCQSLSPDDVRITTRFDEHFVQVALFGTLHETGHGLYEQGCLTTLHPILASGTSLGVHESQSRLWENVVGRSHGFWEHYYPLFQAQFPGVLDDVSLDTFYGAVNTSKPSLIRVEADEVTYNLHILLRFEMENDLLEGKLKVADAPAVWNAKMHEYLGITPPTDTLGILQDVHWSGGMFGYFPTYTIGNLLSAQLYKAATAAHPEIPAEIAQGKFSTLLGWLRTNIHRHGRKFLPTELVKRATGEPLNSSAYLAYLTAKYNAIYGLDQKVLSLPA